MHNRSDVTTVRAYCTMNSPRSARCADFNSTVLRPTVRGWRPDLLIADTHYCPMRPTAQRSVKGLCLPRSSRTQRGIGCRQNDGNATSNTCMNAWARTGWNNEPFWLVFWRRLKVVLASLPKQLRSVLARCIRRCKVTVFERESTGRAVTANDAPRVEEWHCCYGSQNLRIAVAS